MSACTHDFVRDTCHTASTECLWERRGDGDYEPGDTEVTFEEDNDYECMECGEAVVPVDGDGPLRFEVVG